MRNTHARVLAVCTIRMAGLSGVKKPGQGAVQVNIVGRDGTIGPPMFCSTKFSGPRTSDNMASQCEEAKRGTDSTGTQRDPSQGNGDRRGGLYREVSCVVIKSKNLFL